MSNNPQPKSQPWTLWQKILFRFFFVFLSLQVVTENFLGNLWGNQFLFPLAEKIFTSPCLWLNKHIFHFKYAPASWTRFSLALHTIRDIVYLIIAAITCITWSMLDKKRTNYNRLHYWFSQSLIIVLSAITFSYGSIKVLPLQMAPPTLLDLQKTVGELSPFNLIWTAFGYGQPYQIFSGLFEVIGGIMILYRRTRVVGLLILASVMINVILINYTYAVGVLMTACYILVVIFFLLAPYVQQLLRFFFTQQPVALSGVQYAPVKNFKTILFTAIAVLFLGTSFVLTSRSSMDRYVQRENITRTRKYSIVKNYIVDKDTLRSFENDTLRWRIWSERVIEGKRYVTISTMKPGFLKTYTIDQDSSSHHITLYPYNQKDSTSLHFNYTDINKKDWQLEGNINQKNVLVDLQKIRPDTVVTLLKVKRSFITFDDDPDVQ